MDQVNSLVYFFAKVMVLMNIENHYLGMKNGKAFFIPPHSNGQQEAPARRGGLLANPTEIGFKKPAEEMRYQ